MRTYPPVPFQNDIVIIRPPDLNGLLTQYRECAVPFNESFIFLVDVSSVGVPNGEDIRDIFISPITDILVGVKDLDPQNTTMDRYRRLITKYSWKRICKQPPRARPWTR